MVPCIGKRLVLLSLALCVSCAPRERVASDPPAAPFEARLAELDSALHHLRAGRGTDGAPAWLQPQAGPSARREHGRSLPPAPLPDTIARAAAADHWQGPQGEEVDPISVLRGTTALLERATVAMEAGDQLSAAADLRSAWRAAGLLARYGGTAARICATSMRERTAQHLARLRTRTGQSSLGAEWALNDLVPLSHSLRMEALLQQRTVQALSPRADAQAVAFALASSRESARWIGLLVRALEQGNPALQHAQHSICEGRWVWGRWALNGAGTAIGVVEGPTARQRWLGRQDGRNSAANLLAQSQRTDEALARAERALGRPAARARLHACEGVTL